MSLPPVQNDPHYVFYTNLVMKGFLTWGSALGTKRRREHMQQAQWEAECRVVPDIAPT